MSTTTGPGSPGFEIPAIRELALAAENRIRITLAATLLAIAAGAQLAFIVTLSLAPTILVYAEVGR